MSDIMYVCITHTFKSCRTHARYIPHLNRASNASNEIIAAYYYTHCRSAVNNELLSQVVNFVQSDQFFTILQNSELAIPRLSQKEKISRDSNQDKEDNHYNIGNARLITAAVVSLLKRASYRTHDPNGSHSLAIAPIVLICSQEESRKTDLYSLQTCMAQTRSLLGGCIMTQITIGYN